MKHQLSSLIFVIALLAAPGAFAQSARPAADEWRFSLLPYLWLPSMNGDLRYGPPRSGGATPSVSVDSEKILDSLEFALMISGEARKGRWFVGTDLMYIDLSGTPGGVKSVDFNPGAGPINITNTSLNLATENSLKGTVWSLIGGYAVVQEPHATFDVFGGFRYLDIKVSTTWNLSAAIAGPAGSGLTFARAGSFEQSDDLWDGIVGVKGRFNLGASKWFVPYYLDVGSGSSDTTWQAMAGVGYSYRWGDVVLAYRHLAYKMGGNKLLEDVSLGGPALGVNFRF